MMTQDATSAKKAREATPGEPAANLPPAPLDPVVRADHIVAEFTAVARLDEAAKNKLRDLILAAIDERLEETQDLRLGRVLGSALATL